MKNKFDNNKKITFDMNRNIKNLKTLSSELKRIRLSYTSKIIYYGDIISSIVKTVLKSAKSVHYLNYFHTLCRLNDNF